MNIHEFKIIRNRQRPDFCYQYLRKRNDKKYSISTFDGGKTFHASIEQLRLDKRWYSELSVMRNSIEECLNEFKELEKEVQ